MKCDSGTTWFDWLGPEQDEGSEKIFRIDTSAVDRTTYYRRSDTNRQRLIHKAKMKSLRISVVIVVAFVVCWTPYYIMMLIFMFLNPTERFGEDLQSGIFFFGMSNSLINPLIYGAFHLVPIRQRRNQYNQHVRYICSSALCFRCNATRLHLLLPSDRCDSAVCATFFACILICSLPQFTRTKAKQTPRAGMRILSI
uniref:G-protein coupled receptors family 1 profile domain-containing protein n=1 Tax=Anopheles maculatus TaxID=74869 RepID=A0A182SZT1_9DIPT